MPRMSNSSSILGTTRRMGGSPLLARGVISLAPHDDSKSLGAARSVVEGPRAAGIVPLCEAQAAGLVAGVPQEAGTFPRAASGRGRLRARIVGLLVKGSVPADLQSPLHEGHRPDCLIPRRTGGALSVTDMNIRSIPASVPGASLGLLH